MTIMTDFLQGMADTSRQRAAEAKRILSADEIKQRCQDLPATTALLPHSGGFDVIAEIKVRSPAEGQLDTDVTTDSVVARARQYIEGGAAALSVLTEPSRFEGSLEYLSAVAKVAGVPVMRKDFLVDVYQLYEARLAGADGVLLIARLLSDEVLAEMLAAAKALGLFVLLEAFDQNDLQRCHRYARSDVLIGLNCRDLTTLQIDPQRFAYLRSSFPANSIKVAESGIQSIDQACALAQQGYQMALIGTTLMKTEDPAAFLRNLLSLARKGSALRGDPTTETPGSLLK